MGWNENVDKARWEHLYEMKGKDASSLTGVNSAAGNSISNFLAISFAVDYYFFTRE